MRAAAVWSRPGYLAVTAGLLLAGTWVAAELRFADPAELALAVALAWALQVPFFWRLASHLERGERVMGTWVGGMAVRLGGVPLLAVIGADAGFSRSRLLIAYLTALVGLLLLEVLWLQGRSVRS